MQVASFLSDMKTLDVCSHEAAMHLVTKYRSSGVEQTTTSSQKEQKNDVALRQADELLSLHKNVKLKHLDNGLDADFVQAREEVSRILTILEKR